MVATVTLIQLGQYAASLAAILTCFGLIVKWAVVMPIKAYIDQMTYPIQPTSNGGNSLPDVVRTLTRIETKIHELESRIGTIESDTPNCD